MKTELVAVSDWAWGRTNARLADLTDEEMFWEPYPGCWTLRRLRDGTWISDCVGVETDVAPLTTIVWRVIHLIGCYGSARNSEWSAVKVDQPGIESWVVTPSTAAEARETLSKAHDRWRAVLDAVEDSTLGLPLGPIAGQWAEATRAGFLIHQLDEVIHHGAEIGLMRDLYRASKGPPHSDPVVARLLTGDLSAFDEVASRDDLVSQLAGAGRWDLVEEALVRGASPDGPAPTALHRAAANNLIPIVDRLLGAGASTAVRDPQFNMTPSAWAQYFGHSELAERLQPGD